MSCITGGFWRRSIWEEDKPDVVLSESKACLERRSKRRHVFSRGQQSAEVLRFAQDDKGLFKTGILNMSPRALIELLHGKGAHADPVACVEDLSAELAARPVAGFPHSVGQLVFHMNYWMDYELRRIRGEKPDYPEHSAESFPATPSPVDAVDWDRLRKRFAGLLDDFCALGKSSRVELDRAIETVHEGDTKVAGTLEAVLWQMVAHNSYHVGQVAMIRRALGAWPPRGGGDSW
jgi:uncharacterized damage-inducible protein DinB